MQLYLSSIEYNDFLIPKRIIEFKHLDIEKRKSLKIVVDIPLIGQKYGFPEIDFTYMYLVGKYNDKDLLQLKKFPIGVHVLIPFKTIKSDNDLSFENLQNIAWALLYDNLEDAIAYK